MIWNDVFNFESVGASKIFSFCYKYTRFFTVTLLILFQHVFLYIVGESINTVRVLSFISRGVCSYSVGKLKQMVSANTVVFGVFIIHREELVFVVNM